MGFWGNLLSRNIAPVYFRPTVSFVGAGEFDVLVGGMTVSDVWRTQPHVRTVVSFLARNIGQLGLPVYHNSPNGGRTVDAASPLARALRKPGDGLTTYDLLFALVGDIALYDRAYWIIGMKDDGTWRIRRLPPSWVTPIRDTPWEVTEYEVVANDGSMTTVPASVVLDFTGYAPGKHQTGSPAVEALKATIIEQLEATKYRAQTWKRGGRASAVLQRPAGAPQWSDGAREQFREDWYSKYTGNGSYAGGTPILEDGMTLNRIDFSATDQQYAEVIKLNLATVASAFHINPTMVGLLDNANYSNVREFRRMLYGDTLGPILTQIEDRVNTFLIPMLGMDPDVSYVEFNIADKTQGTFEEQLAAMQSAVGRPFMTADEARERIHFPALGGDASQLVTPLNVLVGGQASPTDSGSQNAGPKYLPYPPKAMAGPHTKGATPAQQEQIGRVLDGFLKRQGASVLAAIGAGSKDWWDGDRWDRELATDLTKVSHTIADILGKAEADRLGYPDGYDPDRTVAFLQAVMERKAGNINATTRKSIEAAIADPDGDPSTVFDADARGTRASALAVGLGTFAASFAKGEAARQIAYDHGGNPTKTWVTGANARPTHAAMNGETVGIDEPFSNGCMWPADGPDVDETAGCNCSVEIGF